MGPKVVVRLSAAEKKAKQALAKLKRQQEEAAAEEIKHNINANAERQKLLEKSGPERQMKMAIASMTKALWKFELTTKQREDMKHRIAQYEKEIKALAAGATAVEIEQSAIQENLKFISSAPELVQVMRLFWICMMPFLTKNNNVSKRGYIKLMMNMQYALNGNPDEVAALKVVDSNWTLDMSITS